VSLADKIMRRDAKPSSGPSAAGNGDISSKETATWLQIALGFLGLAIAGATVAIAWFTYVLMENTSPAPPTGVSIYVAATSPAHVLSVSPGICNPSQSSKRTDAFRCFAGDYIYDPCFVADEPPGPTNVVCPADPRTTTVWEVQTTPPTKPSSEAISVPDPISSHDPWAVLLSNGTVCYYNTGTHDFQADLGVTYACGEPSFTGFVSRGQVIGDVDRTKESWTALYSPSRAQPYKSTRIRMAWF
jgi:hypothetical protein